MTNRTPGRHGVTDLWYKPDGTATSLAAQGSTKKRPAGKGSRWRGWYVDAEGRERRKNFATKPAAQRWSTDQGNAIFKGTWIAPERGQETVEFVADKWLATKAHRQPTTVAEYRSVLENYILPKYRDVAIKDIGHEELQDWVNYLAERGCVGNVGRPSGGPLGAARIRKIIVALGGILRYAIATDRITKDPTQGLSLPDIDEGERAYLSHQQLQDLAKKCEEYRVMTLVLGYCGLRISEAIALRRKNVTDATAPGNGGYPMIHVRRKVVWVKGKGLVEGPPKNRKERHVPIPAIVWEELQPILPSDPDALVFPSRVPARNGGWMTRSEYYGACKKAAEALGLKGITAHGLRHTTASLAISGGANVKALQNLLGHKTATITLDRYAHLFSDDLTRVATALDAAARAAQDRAQSGA